MGCSNVAATSDEFAPVPAWMLERREKEINTSLRTHHSWNKSTSAATRRGFNKRGHFSTKCTEILTNFCIQGHEQTSTQVL